MDPNSLPLPVIVAILLGVILKRAPQIENKLIPFILFGAQVAQSLAGQLSTSAQPDFIAAASAAIPVVATAVLAHQSGKGLQRVFGWLRACLPVLGAVAKVVEAVPAAAIAPAAVLAERIL